ncbi:MAG: hypothetical protein HYU69_06030 [Bacteroidetes bacterium]|nr:hypothetical protein [Bacteroidota bacterium]
MQAIADNRKDHFLSFISSVLVFGLIILFLLLFLIKTPIPPYPPSIIQEVEITFEGGGGEDGAEGMGNPGMTSSVKANTNTTSATEDIFSSSTEDPVLTVKEERKKEKKKEKKIEEKIRAQEDPQPSQELMNLIANVKDKLKNSSGNSTNTDGNGKAGDGDGQGKGNGDGPGEGNNVGPGKGPGYSLRGRKLLQRPQLLDESQEEGIVVVEIVVDETGKVIEATPGQRGSTTTSSYLYTLARQAAKTAKFNVSPDGAKEQKGTYTFVFRLD